MHITTESAEQTTICNVHLTFPVPPVISPRRPAQTHSQRGHRDVAAAEALSKHVLKPTTHAQTWGWGFTTVAPGQGMRQQQLLIKSRWLNSYS